MSAERFALGLLLPFVLLAGCDAGLSGVTGQVKLDGNPVPNAIVTFIPVAGGSSASATTDPQGKYTLMSVLGDGLPPGKYKVSISSAPAAAQPAPEIDMNSPEYLKMASGAANESALAKPQKDPIPEKYNSATELTQEVTAGDQTVDFDLKSS